MAEINLFGFERFLQNLIIDTSYLQDNFSLIVNGTLLKF